MEEAESHSRKDRVGWWRVTPNAFAASRRNFHHYARTRASLQKLLSYTDKAVGPTGDPYGRTGPRTYAISLAGHNTCVRSHCVLEEAPGGPHHLAPHGSTVRKELPAQRRLLGVQREQS